MDSGFNTYQWNGAVWNGSTEFIVLDFMQIVCITAIVQWEVSIISEIPRC